MMLKTVTRILMYILINLPIFERSLFKRERRRL